MLVCWASAEPLDELVRVVHAIDVCDAHVLVQVVASSFAPWCAVLFGALARGAAVRLSESCVQRASSFLSVAVLSCGSFSSGVPVCHVLCVVCCCCGRCRLSPISCCSGHDPDDVIRILESLQL